MVDLSAFGMASLVPVDALFCRYPQLALSHLCLRMSTRQPTRRRAHQQHQQRDDELEREVVADECRLVNVARHRENLVLVVDVLGALLLVGAVQHVVRVEYRSLTRRI